MPKRTYRPSKTQRKSQLALDPPLELGEKDLYRLLNLSARRRPYKSYLAWRRTGNNATLTEAIYGVIVWCTSFHWHTTAPGTMFCHGWHGDQLDLPMYMRNGDVHHKCNVYQCYRYLHRGTSTRLYRCCVTKCSQIHVFVTSTSAIGIGVVAAIGTYWVSHCVFSWGTLESPGVSG